MTTTTTTTTTVIVVDDGAKKDVSDLCLLPPCGASAPPSASSSCCHLPTDGGRIRMGGIVKIRQKIRKKRQKKGVFTTQLKHSHGHLFEGHVLDQSRRSFSQHQHASSSLRPSEL